MRLTLFFDLSLHIVTLMAMGKPGRKHTAAEMAEPLNASRVYVSKVISQLVELGFLDAIKGHNGSVHPRDLATDESVGKLLRTLEGNEVVGCAGTDCPLLPTCLLCGKLAVAQEAFSVTFDLVLTADLTPVKLIGGADDDTPEGDSVPKGSIPSIRPVQVQS